MIATIELNTCIQGQTSTENRTGWNSILSSTSTCNNRHQQTIASNACNIKSFALNIKPQQLLSSTHLNGQPTSIGT